MAIIDKLIIICGILAVLSFVATVVTLSRRSNKEDTKKRKRVEAIGASVFVGSIGLVLAFAFIVHNAAIADLKVFLETDSDKIQVKVNNEFYNNGKTVIAAIQNIRPELFDSDMISNNESNIKFVSLIKGNHKLDLRLVQHGESREYYVYYPLYLTTDKNPLGLVNSW